MAEDTSVDSDTKAQGAIALAVMRRLLPIHYSLRKYYAVSATVGIPTILILFVGPHHLANILWRDGVTYFTALGALFGTVLAIAFSVSTLMMQHAAENTSAGFYDVLARDRVRSALYVVIAALTFACFAIALLHSAPISRTFSRWTGIASLWASGVVAYSLYIIYRRVYERINPSSALSLIRRGVERDIALAKKYSRGHVIKLSPSAVPIALGRTAALTEQVGQVLNTLLDLHDRKTHQSDMEFARHVLTAVKNIMADYLEFRKDSTFAFPTLELFATTSDYSAMLSRFSDRALISYKAHLERGNHAIAVDFIRLAGDLAIKSHEITIANTKPWDNPAYMSFSYTLVEMHRIAQGLDSHHALFKYVVVATEVGEFNIKRGMPGLNSSLSHCIMQIAIHGIAQKSDSLLDKAVECHVRWLNAMLNTPKGADVISLRECISALNQLLVGVGHYLKARDVRIESPGCVSIAYLYFYLESMSTSILSLARECHDPVKVKLHVKIFVTLIDGICDGIQSFGKSVKSIRFAIIGDMAGAMQRIICAILSAWTHTGFKAHKKELERCISHCIWCFGAFFSDETTAYDELEFGMLTDATAKIGITLSQQGQGELCMSALAGC
ncbi:MAG: hypothetical protein KAU35_07030 [candidate division Zixibacteria bacterium]|nr:hypothetical protein [candidate division Zixibacteria bacterium]